MNTKELIMNITETKNRMRICVDNLNHDVIQTVILKGPVTDQNLITVLSKLHTLTEDCLIDIYNLDKLCKYLENLSEEEKEKEL